MTSDNGAPLIRSAAGNPSMSNFEMEVLAVRDALAYAADARLRYRFGRLTILTDNQTAVTTAQSPSGIDSIPSSVLEEIRHSKNCLTQMGVQICLDWIPAHTTSPLNGLADKHSKLAAEQSRTNPRTARYEPVSYATAKRSASTRLREAHMKWWAAQSDHARDLKAVHPKLSAPRIYKGFAKIKRRTQCCIDRIRIGAATTKASLHKFRSRLVTDDRCEKCQAQDSVEHRVVHCPHYQALRVKLQAKLRDLGQPFSVQTLFNFCGLNLKNLQRRIQAIAEFLEETKLTEVFVYSPS